MKDRSKSTLLAWIVTAVLAGCSTLNGSRSSGVRIESVGMSLRNIKKCVAVALPGGIRDKSTNLRTFSSRYVDLNGQRWDLLSRERWRAFVEITIYGDRRPYTLDVVARVEERETEDPMDLKFSVVGQSEPLARRISQRVRACLEDRRKKKNYFDEFRAF